MGFRTTSRGGAGRVFTVEGVEFPITQGNNIHFIDLNLLSFLWSSDLYYSWQTSESLRGHLGQRKPWKQPVSPAALTSLHCPVFLFSGSVCCTGRDLDSVKWGGQPQWKAQHMERLGGQRECSSFVVGQETLGVQCEQGPDSGDHREGSNPACLDGKAFPGAVAT